jgi:hypothetical protein
MSVPMSTCALLMLGYAAQVTRSSACVGAAAALLLLCAVMGTS